MRYCKYGGDDLIVPRQEKFSMVNHHFLQLCLKPSFIVLNHYI